MSNFTYEKNETMTKLETYEWDNTWIEQANDRDTRRIMYIGDSISCGTRKVCTAVSNGSMLFDGFGTSKAVDNPWFFDSLAIFAKQQPRYDAVIFNNGLHGWHLNDVNEYNEYYESLILRIRELFGDTPLYLVLTTSVADDEREKRVKARNEAVLGLSLKYSLPVIDLYKVSVDNVSLRAGDGVHFTSEGYEKFAIEIVNKLK